MKTLWTTQYLSDMQTEAEIAISAEIPCIYVRFPMNITQSVQIYDFTDTNVTSVEQYLTGIIRVTWKGHTVHPDFFNRMWNRIWPLTPANSDAQSSRPFVYMRQGFGLNRIKFWPSPNLGVTYDNSNINTQDGIRNNVIVSGWRIADPTGATYRIPDYIRERLVRYYALSKAFKKEGKGQNVEAAKFYELLYTRLLEKYKKIVMQLFSSRTACQSNQFPEVGMRPGRPVLPSNFGPIVW